MLFRQALTSMAGRRLLRPISSTVSYRNHRWFSTEPHRVNEEIKPSYSLNNEWTIDERFPSAAQNLQTQEKVKHDLDVMEDSPRTSILMELSDRVGVLHDVLRYFWKYDINVTRIESRPLKGGEYGTTFDFFLDFDGSIEDANCKKLLKSLDRVANKLLILDSKDVYWFPRHISELDLVANRTLDAGVDLEADHPGFHDQEYRARRAIMAENAEKHVWDQPIPRVQYTQNEIEVWSAVWDKMDNVSTEM